MDRVTVKQKGGETLNKSEIEGIVAKMRSFTPTIETHASSDEEIQNAITFIRYDYPTVFHVGQINYSFDKATGKAILKPTYLTTQPEYEILINECRVKLTEYKKKLLLCKNDYEKELLIHDELCKNIVYADEGECSHSMIGPLIFGKGVCDGIARTAHELFHLVGVRSHVVGGTARDGKTGTIGPHVWNLVLIDGKWYNLDITFDNTISSDEIRYDYFNLSSDAIKADHTIKPEYEGFLAHCTDNEDYFLKDGRSFSTVADAEKFIIDSLKGRKDTIYFRLAQPYTEAARAQLINTFETNIKKFYSQYKSNYSVNDARNVYCWNIEYGGKASRLFVAILKKLIKN